MLSAFGMAVFWLALVVWIGGVIHFSLVAAPSAFGALGRDTAGQFVAAVFPKYYAIGLVCGVVTVAAGFWLLPRVGWLAWTRLAGLCIMLLANVIAGYVIQPRAHAVRAEVVQAGGEAAPEALRTRFARLHRLAVQLNVAVLLCGLWVIVTTAVALRL